MNKKEKALKYFRSDMNCAQSVLTACSEDLDFDKKLALSIASGFGAGMGRLQETCGAVTGAYMVLGVYNSKKYSENDLIKEETYSMIQEFERKFIAIHRTTSCAKLINCDMRTEEGFQYMMSNNLLQTICAKCIGDAMDILEEMINENN